MATYRGDPTATALQLKRRPPCDRETHAAGTLWALAVTYPVGEEESYVLLPLTDDDLALQVDVLLPLVKEGDRAAALDLFACLHEQRGKSRFVARHPAWDAVFRYLTPIAAPRAGQSRRRRRRGTGEHAP